MSTTEAKNHAPKATPNNPDQMTGAEIIIQALIDQGVEVVFGYPGGAVLPIYDEIFKNQDKIKHVLVRQEGGALHAAEGYARSTGKVGCALVTSGPGATNAVTGLTDALLDSIPLVCITGQVPTFLVGTDAFQEADTTGITRPCTKHNYLIKDANKVADIIHEAFHVARSGRPGPVVIDIPKDVQFAKGAYKKALKPSCKPINPKRKPTAQQSKLLSPLWPTLKNLFFTPAAALSTPAPKPQSFCANSSEKRASRSPPH